MASQPGGQRPFPAPVVVFLLLLGCIFLGQMGIPRLLPGMSGLARLDMSLILIDIPLHLPVTIDLVWAPALFLLLYTLVLLVYPFRSKVPRWRQVTHRLGAALAAFVILVAFVAAGGLVAWWTQDRLPRGIHNGLESMGINANLYLSGNQPFHLHGNVFTLLMLIIGMAIAIRKISVAPVARKATELTREQRMTPYQRMLEERSKEQPRASKEQPRKPSSQRSPTPAPATRPSCYNQPIFTLKPEAVNYRPM